MCGFAGFLMMAPGAPADMETQIRRMADTLAHRGPDDSGVWHDAESGVALGHRRLSVLDLSPAAAQPMVSANGRYTLVYNGEIYNYRALHAQLGQSPAALRGHSDTEVLLESMASRGVRPTLEDANGMFAFALWDRKESTLTLGRDRFGQKPLFFGLHGGGLVFASELKGVTAFDATPPDISRNTLALFLRYGYIPAPWSIYENIYKLLPGTLLRLPADALRNNVGLSPRPEDGGPLKPERYFSAASARREALENPLDGPPEARREACETLLKDAVNHCTIADVPVGTFLSGGIDSSLITALMQKDRTDRVRSFSIGFAREGFNEADHARAIAKHLGTDHTELTVTEQEARDVIPDLPAMYDEPFADSSQIPTHLVSRLARRNVTVALSGDGGDELFGGYNRYFWGLRLHRLRALPAPVRRLCVSLLAGGGGQMAERLSPLLPSRFQVNEAGDKLAKVAAFLSAPSPQAAYHRLVSILPEAEDLVPGSTPPLTPYTDPKDWPDDLPGTSAQGLVHAMMLLDTQVYLADDILAKVDRAAMATSLETRIPFLDHRVFSLAWRLPDSDKAAGGGKKILKDILARHVPPALFTRPKSGFGVPLSAWLNGALREWAEDLLAPAFLEKDGVLDVTATRHLWMAHKNGTPGLQHALWAVLMYLAWRREGP